MMLRIKWLNNFNVTFPSSASILGLEGYTPEKKYIIIVVLLMMVVVVMMVAVSDEMMMWVYPKNICINILIVDPISIAAL